MYSGFRPDEVAAAAKATNYHFSGVAKTSNSPAGIYGIRYAQFVLPLVKAAQELSVQNDSLKNNVQPFQYSVAALQQQLNDLKAMIVSMQQSPCSESSQTATTQSYAVITDGASLEQNIPNPFRSTTNTNYTLPQKYSNAYIIVMDNNGKTLKQINVSGSGKSSVTLDASVLAAGAYRYSLYVDGKMIDSKQMVSSR